MALPAVVGVGAVLSFFAEVIAKFLSRFTERQVSRLAAIAVFVAALIALITALAAGIGAILSGLSAAMPSELAQGIGMFKPDNFEACVSAIITSKVAIWVYNLKRDLMEMQARV